MTQAVLKALYATLFTAVAQLSYAQTEDVEQLQQALADLGYDGRQVSDVENNFSLEQAVRQFQADNFLPITGQLSEDQISALLQDIEQEKAKYNDVLATIDPDLIPPVRSDSDRIQIVNEVIRQHAQDAMEHGFVYRSPKYWNTYNQSQVIQNIFNGEFFDYESRSYAFAMFFNAYVAAYSRDCSNFLPAGSAVYTFQQRTQTFNGFGYQTGTYVSWEDEIVVHPDLQPFYEQFRNHPASSEQFQVGISDLFGAGPASFSAQGRFLRRFLMEPFTDFRAFLSVEGCSSIPQRQMESNLLAHANGNPSLQDTGAGFDDAMAVSTSPQNAILSETDIRLATEILEEIDANMRRHGDRLLISEQVSDDAIRWFDGPIYLDGQTIDFQTQSDGQAINWQDVYSLYVLLNRDSEERRRFEATVFDDDSGRRYVGHFRIGWRRHQTGIESVRLTFMIRELACEAVLAGVEFSIEGGDSGFWLLQQPHFRSGSNSPRYTCSLANTSSFYDLRRQVEARQANSRSRELREMVWRGTPGCTTDGGTDALAQCPLGPLDEFLAQAP